MKDLKKLGYSKRDAALVTSLSVRMIHNLINQGVLKAINVGSRVIITAKSLERFMQVGAVPYKKDSSNEPMHRSNRIYGGAE